MTEEQQNPAGPDVEVTDTNPDDEPVDGGEHGTQEDADRSQQRPGAGDPRETHDPQAGRGEDDAAKL